MIPFDVFTYDACQIFALMVVLKSGIRFVWLMNFLVSKGIYIWEAGQHVLWGVTVVNAGLTLMWPFLNELQRPYLKLLTNLRTWYIFGVKSIFGGMLFSRTMSPILQFAILGYLIGVVFYLVPFSNLILPSCKFLMWYLAVFCTFCHPCT